MNLHVLVAPEPFRVALLSWFSRIKRVLPWRTPIRDPYHVWVSEIMLQQTQVKTVIPYYERFLTAYPTVQALAAAPLDDVLKFWEGLGYYSRCRNLHKGACYVVEQCQGRVPSEPGAILAVPGIGPYTAGAILSIAYDVPEPAVDGNVMRVLARYLALAEDIAKPATRQYLEVVTRQLMCPEQPGNFTEAMMELGALTCTPRQPDCPACPLQATCVALGQGNPEAYPVKTKAKGPRLTPMAVGLLQQPNGRYLLIQQPAQGIFARLWCFPFVEVTEVAEAALNDCLNGHGLQAPDWQGPIGHVAHTLTHRQLEMALFLATAPSTANSGPATGWFDLAAMEQLAMPVAHQKIKQFMWAHPLLMLGR